MSNYVPNQDMVQFWEAEVAPVIMPLFNGTYGLPKIQVEYNKNAEAFKCLHGNNINITLSDVIPKDTAGEGGFTTFGCSLIDGRPSIVIFVQQVKAVWELMKRQRPLDYFDVFATSCIIGIMHEFDHHVLQQIGDEIDALKNIEAERIVWAKTCEHTIRSFIWDYGRELTGSHREMWLAWERSGRNAESQQWKDFITSLYGRLKRG